MSIDFAFQSAIELSRAIAAKQIFAVELMQATLARAERINPQLNCFASYAREQALEAAKRADLALKSGQPMGRLHGLPISVKDLIAVKDLKFTFGSKAMVDNLATADAPSVERLRAAGACIIGKTTTSEFGCKAVGDSPLTGITRNPWHTGNPLPPSPPGGPGPDCRWGCRWWPGATRKQTSFERRPRLRPASPGLIKSHLALPLESAEGLHGPIGPVGD